MRTVTTAVVGAGHAGLAMSRCLTERAIDHVVLERGEVANAWRTQRWESLRLLTPNWQTRLPGFGYDGDDPDGYLSVPEVIEFIGRYAQVMGAPVRTQTTVTSVRFSDPWYKIATDQGAWRARSVVLAAGGCAVARVPAVAAALPAGIDSVTTTTYRNPDRLADGGVLVVGASATGIQLAGEIHRSGRPVILAVGEHVRLPRTYRGRDILWWMDRAGVLDERYDSVDDIARARRVPSPQLTGSRAQETTDLNALSEIGVRLVGRLAGIADGQAQFSGSLGNVCKLADLKMNRLLDTIDAWAHEAGVDGEVPPPRRFAPTRVDDSPPLSLDLTDGTIKTVVWATGYRPDLSWLHMPVQDRKGRLRHDGGVVAPGLYAMGLPFLRRRKSGFIDGAADDARDLSTHLAAYLDTHRSMAIH